MAASAIIGRCQVNRLVSVAENSKLFNRLKSVRPFHRCFQHNSWTVKWRTANVLCNNLVVRQNNRLYIPQRFISLTQQRNSGKIVQFKLSDIGEGIREVVLKEWFITEGDKVAQFDSICEVQSDKASVTITSRFDGVVRKLYHAIDDTALVGQPLVDIELDPGSEEDLSISDLVTKSSSSTNADSSSSSSSSDSDSDSEETIKKVLATPSVRHLAATNKVNLKNVAGSGKHGRILKEDVFAYLKSLDLSTTSESIPTSELPTTPSTTTTQPPTQPTAPPPPSSPKKHPDPPSPSVPPIPILPLISRTIEAPKDRSEVISGLKKAMVKSMTSANLVPHFSLCDEINVSELVHLRPSFKETAQKYGIRFSYTSVFIKAASLALLQYPLLNSSVDAECKHIIYKGPHNIGVAMDSPSGLIVPNIKNVAQLSVLEVALELNRLIQLASLGKLGPSDLTGGTFTLSNVGMIGGTYTKPVIFVPEVVIGALGSIAKLPRYDSEGKVTPAHIMNVSWSADHRVIDGATLARFSNLWKSYLENPASLLLHLR